ncbi:ferredoxin [Desulfovibrio inopinatus]|uniref:ferredoxin n=1 Tax=Desulfovibrio inopinatus TaxID=102109 RepID=UPI000404329C|nr:ferredoxin [Desulfovibrio inopinatus]
MPEDKAPAEQECEFSFNSVCCHSCGACCEIAPDLFTLDEHGECVCLAQSGPRDRVWEAATHCPNDCIELDDEN